MKKNLIIKDRNKTIYFKNRKVRSPCILEVTDRELESLRLTLIMTGIQHYSIEDKSVDVINSKNEEIIIEELNFTDSNSNSNKKYEDEEPKTILDNLMNGEFE